MKPLFMRALFLLSILTLLVFGCDAPTSTTTTDNIVTSDISNFWQAYDKIQSTTDTSLQMQYLKSHFLDIGTPGLKAIMEARRYQPQEYLDAINNYPLYWNSIRANTNSADKYAQEIQQGINQFKKIYPDYRQAKLYFEIGVFRTPGTTMDSMVLIGAELAMSDENTNTSELPESMSHLKDYAKLNPINDMAFLNVHEYVHTQQNAPWAYDLLSQSIFEGSAEFVAELATNQASIQSAITYGKANNDLVREKFVQEMFSPWIYHWIWNDTNNEFNTRDLGYYMGYAIVKKYYDDAADKKLALKEIIELDYTDPASVEAFVENTGYFPQPLATYKEQFESNRPTVSGLKEIMQNDQETSPDLSTFEVQFSEPMDPRFRSTDLGELGEEHFPKIDSITFADDGLSARYYVQLKPNTTYEMVIESGYRSERAIPLVPYTLKFSTSN